jgi:hypothetical protein
MKIISLIVRRPDLDRNAFAQHYEQRHAPLALRLLPVPFAAYRRNHVVWPDDCPFDCLSEFCFPDPDAAKQIFEYLASDAAQPLHEDEDRFMDRARNAFYEVEEEVVRVRAVGSSGGAVGIWALSAAEPVERDAAIACIHNRVQSASRDDAPAWAVVTELWYPDAATWETDLAAWKPHAKDALAVQVRESVSVHASR